MAGGERTEDDEDRRIAAMILRGAREQAENAKEAGNSAYLDDSRSHGPGRVNQRLFKGEVNQVKSFNKRAGVDAAKLPAMPAEAHSTPLERETLALDREFVRRAHELREGSAQISGKAVTGSKAKDATHRESDLERAQIYSNFGSKRGSDRSFGWGETSGLCFDFARGACLRDNCRFSHDPDERSGSTLGRIAEPPLSQRKRQRVGAHGAVLDVKAAEEEAARQDEEDLELANPLMRGSATAKPRAPKEDAVPASPASSSKDARSGACAAKPPAECWASKKLRVRIVDETGEFKKSHLKKGVIRSVDSNSCRADIELEDGKKLIRAVPQDLLETVVSKTCKNVEIIRGPHRGMLAKFVEKNVKRNVAIVQMGRGDNANDLELKLDDVCEFA
eukprot:TRINITY_DN47820_c0_g1_i1.p1 TRINITY_DN47820_c0_g1~~TRINITY_DN47820_c0_g1_i1.p1  ORF type:complete len:413 (+),score=78.49 TRINITY_DN47820_c0_g1_i1:68-1240(+)